MRVLVVKTSSMGDLVHTLPALTDAMEAIPGIVFDWVAEPAFAEIPHWHPAVADVLAIPLRAWRGKLHRLAFSKERLGYRAAIGAVAYDHVIDAQGLLKSAFLITRLAKGVRHGYDLQSAREPLASLAYHRRHRVDRSLHAITRTRMLFAKALGYPMPSAAPDARLVFARAAQPQPRLVLVPTASRVHKMCPLGWWQAVIDAAPPWIEEILLPIAGEAEAKALGPLAGAPRVRLCTGMRLTEVAELMTDAAAVIAVDTGLCHIADALQVPLLALYGPTAPGLVGPVSDTSTVLKSPTGLMADCPLEAVHDWLNSRNRALVKASSAAF